MWRDYVGWFWLKNIEFCYIRLLRCLTHVAPPLHFKLALSTLLTFVHLFTFIHYLSSFRPSPIRPVRFLLSFLSILLRVAAFSLPIHLAVPGAVWVGLRLAGCSSAGALISCSVLNPSKDLAEPMAILTWPLNLVCVRFTLHILFHQTLKFR